MQMIKVALIQVNATVDIEQNISILSKLVIEAYHGGAKMIITPEVSNFLGATDKQKYNSLKIQNEDPCLFALQNLSAKLGVWLLIGSLALKAEPDENQIKSFVNRSFLINPCGHIIACYDKINMFDVTLNSDQIFNESDTFQAGNQSILIKFLDTKIGLTICYDLRFPLLFKQLSDHGANIICVPSAFTWFTGSLHWEVLLRARAIENKVFILAPAQCGIHGNGRKSWGHSMAIEPSGRILVDGGIDPGINFVDIDLSLSKGIQHG